MTTAAAAFDAVAKAVRAARLKALREWRSAKASTPLT